LLFVRVLFCFRFFFFFFHANLDGLFCSRIKVVRTIEILLEIIVILAHFVEQKSYGQKPKNCMASVHSYLRLHLSVLTDVR